MFSAFRESLVTETSRSALWNNFLSGITIGIIALPLSMALAIATGVAPERGIYTAIVAGIIIAISGGSRTSISGPTAAFVVILLPIVEHHGLGGLLLASCLAGIILILMAVAKLGSLIQVIPYPVTIGFTSGIGVVIGSLQFKDFLGLSLQGVDGHFIPQLAAVFDNISSLRISDTAIGIITLLVLLLWPKLKTKVPSHLVALFVGSVLATVLSNQIEGFQVATISSRFSYSLNGETFAGIPPLLPEFVLPWHLPDEKGQPIGLSLELLKSLIGPAFAIAMLGALESLLCAVVADSMTGTKHHPNDELLGQGIGNLLVPFFGGIPATAALARTAANVRAGATSPLSSIFHSLFLLAAILVLAPMLGYIPMASLAALLLIVAWNMSEARHFIRVIKVAPRGDVWTLLTCFSLTVLVDMEVAIAVGMCLAGLIFIRRSVELTGVKLVQHEAQQHETNTDRRIVIYDIDGPLFFGSAQKALSELTRVRKEIRVVVIDMTDVPMLDVTGLVAVESIVVTMHKQSIFLILAGAQERIISKLNRFGIAAIEGKLEFTKDLKTAQVRAEKFFE